MELYESRHFVPRHLIRFAHSMPWRFFYFSLDSIN